MARGGRRKRRKQSETESQDDGPKHVISRVHAAFLGAVVGGGAGAVLAVEWIEDIDLMLPLAAGGAVVVAVLAAFVGDKVWETVVDWL